MGQGISTETMRTILKLRDKMPTRPWVFTEVKDGNEVIAWTTGGDRDNRISVGSYELALFLQSAAEFVDSIQIADRTLKAVDEAHVKKLNQET